MSASTTSPVTIRSIQEGDVEAIIAIDAGITGTKKAGFWRGVLGTYVANGDEQPEGLSPSLCPVAELDGKVVGFMVGDIQSWQFGMPRRGRIVTIGVHPDYRRRGIASDLIRSLLATFERHGAATVQCPVQPGDPLRDFFLAHGFQTSPIVVLERKLEAGTEA